MTVEDPIEFLHRDNQSIVNQREVSRRHAVVRAGAAQRAAAGSRRHPRRRDARLRDDRDRPARRRNRPPGLLDAPHLDATETINRIIAVFPPHQQKQVRLQLASVLKAVVSQRLVPRADGTRPRAGRRGDDHHPLHPRLHRRQGEDAPHSRRDRRRHVAIRHADLRPVDLRPLRAGARHVRRGAALGVEHGRVQAEGAGHLDDGGDQPRSDGANAPPGAPEITRLAVVPSVGVPTVQSPTMPRPCLHRCLDARARELSEARSGSGLHAAGTIPDAIDDAVARLKAERALDDGRVAGAMARTRDGPEAARPQRACGSRSSRRASHRRRHGPAVDETFGEIDEEALLEAALDRTAERPATSRTSRPNSRRLYSYLVGQGFDPERVAARPDAAAIVRPHPFPR